MSNYQVRFNPAQGMYFGVIWSDLGVIHQGTGYRGKFSWYPVLACYRSEAYFQYNIIYQCLIALER